MTEAIEKFVQIGNDRYLRVPVTAKLRLADPEKLPAQLSKSVRAVASQMYWQDQTNPDLLWVSFILDSEGANANWDYMPRPSLVKNFATAKYKPFDMDHVIKEDGSLVYMDKYNQPPVKNTIFGVMTHTALANADGEPLTAEQIANLDLTDDPDRPVGERVTVVAWAALYSFLFPKTVSSIIEAINDGSMKVSMERWISSWDYMVSTEDGETQAVARAEADDNGIASKWKQHQPLNGAPVFRRSNAFIYGGVASTTNPANVMCRFLDQSVVKAAASVSTTDKNLVTFLTRHSEIHRLFAVSTDEALKSSLIGEHEKLTRAVAAYIGKEGIPKKDPNFADVLDMTLPLDLQGVIELEPEGAKAEAGAETPADTQPNSEESPMAAENQNQPLTTEAVKKVVADMITELKTATDRDNALASRIQGLVEAENTAKARASELQTQITAKDAVIAELKGKLEAAEAAKKQSDKDAEDAKKDAKDAKDAKTKAESNLAETVKKHNDAVAEQVIASRKAKLVETGFGDDKDMTERAVARKEDGSFQITDDIFDAQYKALKAAYEKGKASITPPGTVATPAPVQATASSVVPSSPDLSSAGLYAAGAAAVAAGAVAPTVSGKTQMASAFPAE